MKQYIFLFILATFIGGTLFAQNDVPKNWKTYKTAHYSIRYPKNVKMKKKQSDNNEFVFLLPKQKNAPQEELSLSIQDFSGFNVDTKYLKDKNMENLKTLIPDIIVEEDTPVKIHNADFQRVISKGTYKGYLIKWIQYISIYKNHSYVFTTVSNEELFNGNYALIQQIVHSFKIK